ncbi:hypothetical protein CEXT_579401, partial [Caerostris extrusa]
DTRIEPKNEKQSAANLTLIVQSVNKQAKSALSWEKTGKEPISVFTSAHHPLSSFPPAHAPSLMAQFCTDVQERRSVFRRSHLLLRVECPVEAEVRCFSERGTTGNAGDVWFGSSLYAHLVHTLG